MKRTRKKHQLKSHAEENKHFPTFRKIAILFLPALLVAGCSSLILKPADFSWPIEDELKVDPRGMVQENRYSISLNVKPLLYDETKDTSNFDSSMINIIRDVRGFYFLTGPHFKNVYVFRQDDGCLRLEKKIAVSKEGLSAPAFNQRVPYIELVNGVEKPIMLTKDGIHEEEKK